MADHDTPDDPFFERRLATLSVLPVPERPSLDDLAARAADDDLVTPSADVGRRQRSHQGWLVVGAAAAVLLVLVSIVAVLRSQDAEVASGGIADKLAGHEFWSTSVTEAGIERPIQDHRGAIGEPHVTLAFTADSLRARATCNTTTGPYSIADGHLVVGDDVETTLVGCEEALARQDEWLIGFLTSSPTVAFAGGRLTLTSGTTVIELVDREVADPPSVGTLPESAGDVSALFGPRWELEAYGAGGDRTSVDATDGGAARPWVQFGVDRGRFSMTMRGEDGCTTFGSDAAVMGDAIWFHAPFRLQVACPDADRELVARTMGDVLRGEATYEIDGSRLVIHGEISSLELLAAPEPEETAGTTTKPGRWVSSAVAADDRVITFAFGCAVDGAEAFDHVVVDTSWEKVWVTLVVRVPIEPSADSCTDDVRGTFTVALDEPVAGRAIVQP